MDLAVLEKWGETIVKRIMVLCISLIFLTACIYSKEAKQLKNSETVQTEIETAVKKQAKEKYGIDVEVKMNKLGFAFPTGKKLTLMKTDKRLVLPVETVGEPSYEFSVYMSIYNEAREEYQFNKNSIDLTAMPRMATVFLTDVFKELYKEELNSITEFDEGVEMKVTVEDRFSNRYFEDKEKEDALLMDFAKDYNQGKFADPSEYVSLIRKHAELPNEHSIIYEDQIKGSEPCTPEISMSIEHDDDTGQSSAERMIALTDFIEKKDTLPNGMYFISISEDVPEEIPKRKHDRELVLRCE
jgi:hypothetical protein